VAAYAASLRSDRSGSDATNDKQLSLASRVSHSGPRSGIPSNVQEIVSFPVDEGILNRVQDDEDAKACAASLRSDRSGSDATNNKQLSLASRVSHSGPLSGIPSIAQPVLVSRRSYSPNTTTCSNHRLRTFHHEIVGIGEPDLPRPNQLPVIPAPIRIPLPQNAAHTSGPSRTEWPASSTTPGSCRSPSRPPSLSAPRSRPLRRRHGYRSHGRSE